MNQVPINYTAVVAAAVAAFAVGFAWYGPLFGSAWRKLQGISAEQMVAAQKKGMAGTMALGFLGTLVMSGVLAHVVIFASAYFNVSGAASGLQSAFWCWLGFVAPVTLGKVLWEGKAWKLWYIDAGHYLVAMGVMGAILAAW